MFATERDDRHEVVEHASSPAVVGILHGLVLVLPFWMLVASAIVTIATH
jgi:hypothetical protein